VHGNFSAGEGDFLQDADRAVGSLVDVIHPNRVVHEAVLVLRFDGES